MIKWLAKWMFRLLALLLLALIGVLLMLDTLSKELLERRLEERTGLHASIGRMEVGLLRPRLRLEHVLIYNTADFGGSPMLSMPELYIEYDRAALLKRSLRLTLARAHVSELHVVEGKNGRLNLQAVQERLKARPPGEPRTPAPARRVESFGGLGTLNLSLGRLRYSSLRNPDSLGYYNLNVEHWVQTDLKTTGEVTAALHGLARQKGLEWLWDRVAGKSNAPASGAPRPGG